MWQYASDGKVDGITSNGLDMDVSYRDFAPVAFKCDTTTDIQLSLGQAYQLKVTAKTAPVVTVGTTGVATLLPRYREGDDSYFFLVGIGKPGAAAGVYVNGVKQFVIYAA